MKKWWRSLVLVGLLVTLDCTVQDRAFSCGSKVDLGEFPCGRKLVNVTWKDSNLWFVTRPLHAGDVVVAQSTIESIKPVGRMTTLTTVTQIRTVDGEQVCTARSALVERGA